MPWSWGNTEYSIQQEPQYPTINCLLLPGSFGSLGGRTQLSTFPHLEVNQWIKSQLPLHLHPDLLPPDWPPPSTPTTSLDHSHQVHLETHSITASECVFKFTWLWPPGESQHLLEYGLQVNLLGAMAGVREYMSNRGGLSDREYMVGRPWGRETSSHCCLILSYNEDTDLIFPKFWSHSHFPFYGSMQLCASLWPESIISSHSLPKLVEPEPLILTNYVGLSWKVHRSVDGEFSAF